MQKMDVGLRRLEIVVIFRSALAFGALVQVIPFSLLFMTPTFLMVKFPVIFTHHPLPISPHSPVMGIVELVGGGINHRAHGLAASDG